MANPQPNEFTRISNELYTAIMQTNFSKRQRNILDLVIRMSYGCGKKYAILRPVDFEIVGITKNNIGTELKYLETAKVISIDKETITLNKNYDQWRIGLVKTSSDKRFEEVLKRNLNEVLETRTEQTDGSQIKNQNDENSNVVVLKTRTETPENSSRDNSSERPKESKDIKRSKEIKNIVNVPYDDIKESFNQTCISLPKIRDMTEARKKTLRARWLKYKDIGPFQQLFEMAEESDFLSGRNEKWLNCGFDWLICERNMVKVLEGNYKNKGGGSGGSTSSNTGPSKGQVPNIDLTKHFYQAGSGT